MFVIGLINNLALLIALSLISGMIRSRYTQRHNDGFLQGLLFGSAAVVGMLYPAQMLPGLIFDGRSVMISLCGLFFGPVAGTIAATMAILCRLLQGGTGMVLGVLVCLVSALGGVFFHIRYMRSQLDVSIWRLLVFGITVHVGMLVCLLVLPEEIRFNVFKSMALPILIMYPLATILSGRVLAMQLVRDELSQGLRESEETLRTTLYSIGDGIIATDAMGCVRQMNPMAEKLTGWHKAEAIGKPCQEVFRICHEETREEIVSPVAKVLEKRHIVTLANHTLLIARDGVERPIADSGAPIFNQEGELTGVVLVFRDQTDGRSARRALQTERDNLRALMNASPFGLMVVDSDERIIDANPAAERLFNCAFSEVYYQRCGAFLHCSYWRKSPQGCGHSEHCSACVLSQSIQAVFANGQSIRDKEAEMQIELADGDFRTSWFQFSIEPVQIDGQPHVLIAVNDMTAHRQSEANLKRLEWMLAPQAALQKREVTESSYGDITELNHEGCILKTVGHTMLSRIVSEFLSLLGSSVAVYEANGDCAFVAFDSGWCRKLNEASRNLCQTNDNATALSSGLWKCHESCWTCCSQETIRRRIPMDIACYGGIQLYAVPIFANNEVVGTMTFGHGDPPRDTDTLHALALAYQVPYAELVQKAHSYDSRPPFIIEMAKGRLISAAKLIGSLVEAQQAEDARMKIEAQFRQSQKMEAVGRLAGGVAHDFNNILQAVMGYSELLVEKLPPGEDTHSFAKEILSEGQRAVALTRQLLSFARKETIVPAVFELNEVVKNTLMMLRRLLGEEIDLRWTPFEKSCWVKMDENQLDQILANLAVNARDAITGVGSVTIETAVLEADEEFCMLNSEFEKGRYVVLSVSDDGCGMDRPVLDRLFEPFFTTKGQGKGTGLGLATIYGIVKQNSGFIHVYSEVSRGTTFKIYLPAHEAIQKSTCVAQVREGGVLQTGNETVLLVDDERGLLRSASRLLERLGYQVLAAAGSEEAIKISASHEGPIHILLTDVIMPVMSGRDLSIRLLKERKEMRCIFMSGYTADVIAHHNVLEAGVNYLQKPFSKSALAEKLREVLSSGQRVQYPLA